MDCGFSFCYECVAIFVVVIIDVIVVVVLVTVVAYVVVVFTWADLHGWNDNDRTPTRIVTRWAQTIAPGNFFYLEF